MTCCQSSGNWICMGECRKLYHSNHHFLSMPLAKYWVWMDSVCSLRIDLGTTTNGEPKSTLELPTHLPGTATVPPCCCLYELKGLSLSLMTKSRLVEVRGCAANSNPHQHTHSILTVLHIAKINKETKKEKNDKTEFVNGSQ